MLEVETDKLKIINESKLDFIELLKLVLVSKKIIFFFVLLGGIISFFGSQYFNKKTYIMDVDLSYSNELIYKSKLINEVVNLLVNEINSQLNRKYKVNSKDEFNLIINHDSIGYGLESEIDNKANIIAYNKTHKAKVDSDLSVFYNVNNKNIRFYLNNNSEEYVRNIGAYVNFIMEKVRLDEIKKNNHKLDMLKNKIETYTDFVIEKEKIKNNIKIDRLKQALEIAVKFNIEEPLIGLNNQGIPFQLGSKVIDQEIKMLSSIDFKDQANFNIDLINYRFNKLKTTINNEISKAYGNKVSIGHRKIIIASENKVSITIIGVFFGFIFGMIAALFRKSKAL